MLRTVEVFETSLVATLFTRDLGKVAVLAKGARRPRSPIQGGLDLLGVSDIVLFPKASESLDLLAEAVPVERFASLRRDLAALYAGYYIAELLIDLTDTHDPHPRLFDAARITLRHLGDADLRTRRIMRFELACLRELGVDAGTRSLCPVRGIGRIRHRSRYCLDWPAAASFARAVRPGHAARRPTLESRTSRRFAFWPARATPGAIWTPVMGCSRPASSDGRGGYESCPGASSPASALTGSVTRWFGFIDTLPCVFAVPGPPARVALVSCACARRLRFFPCS